MSSAQVRGLKDWMWSRSELGDKRGVESTDEREDEKWKVGCRSVFSSASGYHCAWTKKITSRRYAGHPTQWVSSSRFRTSGPMDE